MLSKHANYSTHGLTHWGILGIFKHSHKAFFFFGGVGHHDPLSVNITDPVVQVMHALWSAISGRLRLQKSIRCNKKNRKHTLMNTWWSAYSKESRNYHKAKLLRPQLVLLLQNWQQQLDTVSANRRKKESTPCSRHAHKYNSTFFSGAGPSCTDHTGLYITE